MKRELKIQVDNEHHNGNKTLKRLYLRIFFHFLFCAIFFYGHLVYFTHLWVFLKHEVIDPDLWVTVAFAPAFVTNWNVLFQTIFLTMSLVYDLMEWLDRHDSSLGRKLRFARDVMFSGLVVPLTLFISSMFWTLFWIDRELVFPQVYDQLVPWWFNHCVHTNIAIVVLIETVLQARRHPTHYKLELWLTGGAGVLYAIVYYSIYFSTHRWLYGVFGIMTWWQVCLYQLLIWSSTFLFYYIQFPINRIFHREDTSTEKSVTHEPKTGMPNNGFEEPSPGVPESWLKQRPKSQIENSSF